MSDVSAPIPTTFYSYVTDGSEPLNPSEGETWYDTSTDESKVFDGGQWSVQNIESHGALSGKTESDHHNPVSTTDPLTEDGSQGLGLDLGKGLTLSGGSLAAYVGGDLHFDSEGRLAIPEGAISGAEIAFDPATQSELTNHAAASNPHHSPPTSTDYGGKETRTVKVELETDEHYDIFQYVESVEARGDVDHQFEYGVDESGSTNGTKVINIDSEGTHQIDKFVSRLTAGQYADYGAVIELHLRTETNHNHSI